MMIVSGNEAAIVDAAPMWVSMVKELRPDWKPRADWWMEQSALMMESGKYTLLFVVRDGEPIGFGDFLTLDNPATGEVESHGLNIYIKPDFRKTWACGALLRAWKKMSGEKKRYLYTMIPELWKKHGFSDYQYIMRGA